MTMTNEVQVSELEKLIHIITNEISDILSKLNIPTHWIDYINILILIVIASFFVYLSLFLAKKMFIFIFNKLLKISNLKFFKYAINNKLPYYLALIVPYSFITEVAPVIFKNFSGLTSLTIKMVNIYMVYIVISIIMSIIKCFGDALKEKSEFRNKPLKSYYQIIQITLFLFGVVAVYCIITGRSATTFFAAMGAASAVIMLIFKDTILGFVSSIEISANKMAKIGDWITMNKYGADGTVEEINLTTVKVRNFDETITTIPTYALISDSFQNWRGIKEAGGRRFKRAIYIKQKDICFLSTDELEKYKKIKELENYINDRLTNMKSEESLNLISDPNSTSITNNDLFMQYCTYYLKKNPNINQSLLLLTRQLAPTTKGLPIEIYAFTKAIHAVEYEAIISEIINHLICIVPMFKLTIFEESAASDNYNVYIRENKVGVNN